MKPPKVMVLSCLGLRDCILHGDYDVVLMRDGQIVAHVMLAGKGKEKCA